MKILNFKIKVYFFMCLNILFELKFRINDSYFFLDSNLNYFILTEKKNFGSLKFLQRNF